MCMLHAAVQPDEDDEEEEEGNSTHAGNSTTAGSGRVLKAIYLPT